MSTLGLRRSTVLADVRRHRDRDRLMGSRSPVFQDAAIAVIAPIVRVGRVRVGADPTPSSSMNAIGLILAIGAAGAAIGSWIWGLYGLLGGAVVGGGAGYAASRAMASSAATTSLGPGGTGTTPPVPKPPVPTPPDAKEPTAASSPSDFGLPIPAKFRPLLEVPVLGSSTFTPSPFPDTTAFLPTPSYWLPVSTVNSRARVDAHRDLVEGDVIQFIAQYGAHSLSADDTNDMVKLSGVIKIARKAATDQDPAYGVEVVEVLKRNNVTPDLVEPTFGQRMVVSPDQVLDVEAK